MDKKEILETIKEELKKFHERYLSFRAFKITDTSNDVFGVNNKTTGSVPANSVGQTQMKDSSIGQAELKYEVATITISAGQPSGTTTITSGSIILGFYPQTNLDQIIDDISVSGTTLTITLAANATNITIIRVVLLKS